MIVQMISIRVRALGVLGRRAAAPEADDEEDERRLDGDEDNRADGEDEPVELVDRLAVRRCGARRGEAAVRGLLPECGRDDAEGERRERGGDDGGFRPPHGPLRFYSARREPGFDTNVTRSRELKFTRNVVQLGLARNPL